MRHKSMSKNDPAERAVRDIRRKTRRQYSAEEKIRIAVSGLRGEESIAALSRHEGIAEGLYCSSSKEFLEASSDPSKQSESLRLEVSKFLTQERGANLSTDAGEPEQQAA